MAVGDGSGVTVGITVGVGEAGIGVARGALDPHPEIRIARMIMIIFRMGHAPFAGSFVSENFSRDYKLEFRLVIKLVRNAQFHS